MDGVGDRLLATLRRCAPVRVRVYDAQEESRDVAVPTRRKKWSQVVSTIEARPWVRVELLDKQGAVLGYVENDGPAEELEDLGDDTGRRGVFRERMFLELMIKAQTTALQYRDKEHTTLLQSISTILETNSAAMQETLAIMRLQRDEAMELAQIRAAAEQSGDLGEVVKLMEASPKLMQAIGPLLGLLMRPKLTAGKSAAPAATPVKGGK